MLLLLLLLSLPLSLLVMLSSTRHVITASDTKGGGFSAPVLFTRRRVEPADLLYFVDCGIGFVGIELEWLDLLSEDVRLRG